MLDKLIRSRRNSSAFYLVVLLLSGMLISCQPSPGGGGSSSSIASLNAVGVTNVLATQDANDPTIIRVSWTTPSDPNSDIASYRVIATVISSAGIEEANAQRVIDVPAMAGIMQMAEFTNLLRNQSYRFRIVVLNAGGDSIAQSRDEDTAFNTPIMIPEDADGDGDGVDDIMDNCPMIANPSQNNTDDADDGGDACDLDDDNDGVDDIMDNCPMIANPSQNNTDDADDGGDACDDDDDNDMVLDVVDTCPRGMIGWTSQASTDYDSDGCRDSDEDDDDDNDMVLDSADVCPRGDTGWTSNSGTDNDGDGCRNSNDVDDDNDGLIEILDVMALNSVRYNLAGTGLDLTNTDNNNLSGGSSIGCPATSAGMNSCNGYELMQDIDLNDLIGESAPDGRTYSAANNWERIGSCVIGPLTGTTPLPSRLCDTSAADTEQFSGIFEGNDMTISNMQIHIDTNTANIGLAAGNSVVRMRNSNINTLISSSASDIYLGIGFFGAVGSTSVVRNIHMENITISADNDIRLYAVGGLIGYGDEATISNSSAMVDTINATDATSLGGLIGFGDEATISNSSAMVDTINATDANNIGGLVGRGQDATIERSSAIVNTIEGTGASHVGGLVGSGRRLTIIDSSAIVDTIAVVETIEDTGDYIGGLVGFGRVAVISNSSAIVDTIEGDDFIGGLVGDGQNSAISSSSSIVDTIKGFINIGGLIGVGISSTINRSSSIVNTIEASTSNLGGLVGDGTSAVISSSSAIVDTIEGSLATGGLVGDGDSSIISSSSAIVDIIEGDFNTGGLVGFGRDATIGNSSAIVDAIGGSISVGGLVGSGQRAAISSSVALSNEINGSTNVHQLVGGSEDPTSVSDSYWQDDVTTNLLFLSSETRGTSQSASNLRSPTTFMGIYANWANAWCDPTTGVYITDSTNPLATDANRVWNLGTAMQYPVISSACFGDRISPQLQRTLIQRIDNGDALLPLP